MPDDPADSQPGRFRWAVRIESPRGVVRGGGLLLDHQTVLTCAHVLSGDPTIPPSTRDVVVTFVQDPRIGERLAHVDGPWSWRPTTDDRSADLALLRLDPPVTEFDQDHPPLRRPHPDLRTTVRVLGFPTGIPDGAWAYAVGAGPVGSERYQLDPTDRGPRITDGYSGAAVLVEQRPDGPVLSRGPANWWFAVGLVVTKYTMGDPSTAAVMVPVDTVLRYFPWLTARVSGRRPIDPQFGRRSASSVADASEADSIAQWLASAEGGDILLLDHGTIALNQVVAMTDRERTPDVERRRNDSPSSAPPIGSVELGIDARDRSVDDILEQLDDVLAIRIAPALDRCDATTALPVRRRNARSGPSTLVIADLDRAADPVALVDDVLVPLIEHARLLGLRIVVGISRPDDPITRAVQRAVAHRPSTHAELIRAVAALEADEARVLSDEDRFARTRGTQPRIFKRRVALERMIPDADDETTAETLATLVRSVRRDINGVQRRRAVVGGLEEQRRGLQAELGAVRGRAVALYLRTRVEDPPSDQLYQEALDVLRKEPIDLGAVRRALVAYVGRVDERERDDA